MSLVRSNKSKHTNTCINNAQTLWMNVSETGCTRWQNNINNHLTRANERPDHINPLTNERSSISMVSGNNRPSLQITIVGSWGLSPVTDVKTLLPFWELNPITQHTHLSLVILVLVTLWDRKWGAYIHTMMGLTEHCVDSGNGRCSLLNDRFNSMVQK